MLSKKVLIELVGTFLLAFVALTTHNYLAIGATLAALLYLGHGVYNPAIMATNLGHASPNYAHIAAMVGAELIGGMLAFMANAYL
jgi:hypothetical protein